MTPPTPTSPTLYRLHAGVADSSAHALFARLAAALGLAGAELIDVALDLAAPEKQLDTLVRHIDTQENAMGVVLSGLPSALAAHAFALADRVDPAASRLPAPSLVYKRESRIHVDAPALRAAGQVQVGIAGPAHWRANADGSALIIGARGPALALAADLLDRAEGEGPSRVCLTDADPKVLAAIGARFADGEAGRRLELRRVAQAVDYNRLMTMLAPGSLVTSAYTLEEHAAPLDPGALFPYGGIAWDLHFVGATSFLRAAYGQRGARRLGVADGWSLYVHTWIDTIATVFARALDAQSRRDLRALADDARPAP